MNKNKGTTVRITMRAPLFALLMAVVGTSNAVPIEHYQLTFEISSYSGPFDQLPASFGDLSIGATLTMDLCWNSSAAANADNPGRFAEAVCGYSIPLGEITASNGTAAGVMLTSFGSGDLGPSLSFGDIVPRLLGPDAASWFLDDIAFSLQCSSYGTTLPTDLAKCESGDLQGILTIGPLGRPNSFPCTVDCRVGGTGGASLTSIRSVAVPEPATLSLLAFGLVCIGIARRKQSTRLSKLMPNP